MDKIKNLPTKINIEGQVRKNVLMAPYTTFKTGGPADWMVFPACFADVQKTLRFCLKERIDFFVLGKGANILVSDYGIRAVVLNLTSLAGMSLEKSSQGLLLKVKAGSEVSEVIRYCRDREVSCLEFLYGMPSSIGGAVWMNARCYGSEVSYLFESALVLDKNLQLREVFYDQNEWDYKVSPFQNQEGIILEVVFRAQFQKKEKIQEVMDKNKSDREAKGHFLFPCAGSIFKNNHAFGKPSGALIDQAHLKGLRKGDAQVSSWHGNIIVNLKQAKASDIRSLILDVKQKVKEKTGFLLEEEVVYAGDWSLFTNELPS